jgi:hypothetical protein
VLIFEVPRPCREQHVACLNCKNQYLKPGTICSYLLCNYLSHENGILAFVLTVRQYWDSWWLNICDDRFQIVAAANKNTVKSWDVTSSSLYIYTLNRTVSCQKRVPLSVLRVSKAVEFLFGLGWAGVA